MIDVLGWKDWDNGRKIRYRVERTDKQPRFLHPKNGWVWQEYPFKTSREAIQAIRLWAPDFSKVKRMKDGGYGFYYIFELKT